MYTKIACLAFFIKIAEVNNSNYIIIFVVNILEKDYANRYHNSFTRDS